MTPTTAIAHDPALRGIRAPKRERSRRADRLAGRLLEPSAWAKLGSAVEVAVLVTAAIAALLAGGRGQLTTASASLAVLYVLFVVGLAGVPRTRAKRLTRGTIDLCALVLGICSMAIMLAIATESILGGTHLVALAFRLWLLSVALLGGVQAGLQSIAGRARRGGALMTPTLIVGAGVVGARIAGRLASCPEYGLRPVGYLDADPIPSVADLDSGVPVLGGPEDLEAIACRTGARHVILAFSSERDRTMVELVRRSQALGLAVSVVPRLYESVNQRATLDHIGGLPVLGLRTVDPSGWQFAVKHAFDRLAALLALLLLAPALLGIAVAVRLSSPGPVIFRQRRVCRDGRTFDLLKFRTMTDDANPAGFTLADGAAPGGVEGADRRTRVGRWLRSTSLDELPQLINVIRGEMSFVGPRPERPEFVTQFAGEVHRYEDRHRVKSGITGWAQVNGLRGQTSIADRVEWDNHYIQNWSLGLELRTVALTLAEIVRCREEDPVAPVASPQLGPAAQQALTPAPEPEAIPAPERALRVVSPMAASDSPGRWFCGYCGEAPSAGGAPKPSSRVCAHCQQGLLLETRSDVAPGVDEPFLVIDSRLTVQAVSMRAERVLAVSEPDVIDRPVAELFVGADAEGVSEDSFTATLARAASSGEDAHCSFVRPRGTFGVRLRARISPCGPTRAALIVLEPAPTDARLRLVEPARDVVAQAGS